MSLVEYIKLAPSDWVRPRGFASEACSDQDFPNVLTWRELETYLMSRAAAEYMFKEAAWWWERYQRVSKGFPAKFGKY
jgi:hypothetical protein